MYKRSFKARKTDEQQCVSGRLTRATNVSSTFGPANPQSSHSTFAPLKTSAPQTNQPTSKQSEHSNHSSDTPNKGCKRKAFFNEDFSDLPDLTNLPSFKTSFNVTSNQFLDVSSNNSEKKNYNPDKSLEFTLSDIDDDLLELCERDNQPKKSDLSEEDKSNMIAALRSDVSNVSKVPKSVTQNTVVQNDDFSYLLEDDLGMDEQFFSLISNNFPNSQPNKGTRIPSAFKTVNHTEILLNEAQLQSANLRFEDLDRLLLQEIACFIWTKLKNKSSRNTRK